MPPQQGDNDEAPGPSSGGGEGGRSSDDVAVRVVHRQRKGKGDGDDAVVVSPAVGVEEDGGELELRATREMAHYCFGERVIGGWGGGRRSAMGCSCCRRWWRCRCQLLWGERKRPEPNQSPDPIHSPTPSFLQRCCSTTSGAASPRCRSSTRAWSGASLSAHQPNPKPMYVC